MAELEIDGNFTEQQLLYRRNNEAKYNEELKSLILIHNCKKGLFCPVKVCKLLFEKKYQEHNLKFELAPDITNLCQSFHLGSSIKINIVNHGYKGYISCSCNSQDCMPTLLKTLCNINYIK
ncbi:E3 14.7K [Bat mastadenovirus WIV13]|uniref:E3 14.7K n=1 Tax=Bat mastadenovirus WIV13 TaxID=1788435 RepID=A0A1B0UHX9_9ADEN|nr:E3 14.7K [Bat mastadenovirus WIV13]AMB43038.1 E3 14.7K [Bat mastadenovirus WIV13]